MWLYNFASCNNYNFINLVQLSFVSFVQCKTNRKYLLPYPHKLFPPAITQCEVIITLAYILFFLESNFTY